MPKMLFVVGVLVLALSHGATTAPAAGTWTCNVCGHVYNPALDDPAKKNTPFEQLPASWVCPQCGAPKSAYKQSVNAAGEVEWMHEDVHHNAQGVTFSTLAPETWTCSVCGHVYDPAKDDPAKKNTPFEQLPASWVCPECGAPKSAYKKSVNVAGEVEWVHEHAHHNEHRITASAPAPETWTCSVCGHVYDPAKDDPAKKNTPFEQLPATWVCPECGAPKSAYKKSVNAAGEVKWVHEDDHHDGQSVASAPISETWRCSVCLHVYNPSQDDPAKKNTPFEQLPASWVCPVCGAPKSAYKKILDATGKVEWVHEDYRQEITV